MAEKKTYRVFLRGGESIDIECVQMRAFGEEVKDYPYLFFMNGRGDDAPFAAMIKRDLVLGVCEEEAANFANVGESLHNAHSTNDPS